MKSPHAFSEIRGGRKPSGLGKARKKATDCVPKQHCLCFSGLTPTHGPFKPQRLIISSFPVPVPGEGDIASGAPKDSDGPEGLKKTFYPQRVSYARLPPHLCPKPQVERAEAGWLIQISHSAEPYSGYWGYSLDHSEFTGVPGGQENQLIQMQQCDRDTLGGTEEGPLISS